MRANAPRWKRIPETYRVLWINPGSRSYKRYIWDISYCAYRTEGRVGRAGGNYILNELCNFTDLQMLQIEVIWNQTQDIPKDWFESSLKSVISAHRHSLRVINFRDNYIYDYGSGKFARSLFSSIW